MKFSLLSSLLAYICIKLHLLKSSLSVDSEERCLSVKPSFFKSHIGKHQFHCVLNVRILFEPQPTRKFFFFYFLLHYGRIRTLFFFLEEFSVRKDHSKKYCFRKQMQIYSEYVSYFRFVDYVSLY